MNIIGSAMAFIQRIFVRAYHAVITWVCRLLRSVYHAVITWVCRLLRSVYHAVITWVFGYRWLVSLFLALLSGLIVVVSVSLLLGISVISLFHAMFTVLLKGTTEDLTDLRELPWTPITTLAVSIWIWFIWFVRDQMKNRELTHKENEDLKKDLQILQKQAANFNLPSLQLSAVRRLKDFQDGSVLSPEIRDSNPFERPVMLFINSLYISVGEMESRHSDNYQLLLLNREIIESFFTRSMLETTQSTDFLSTSWSNRNLSGLCLKKKKFGKSDFTGTNLSSSSLLRCQLWACDFSEANMRDAKLTRSDLSGSRFHKATLLRTDFTDTSLQGAKFESSIDIETAVFTKARYSTETMFPRGFNLSEKGMIEVERNEKTKTKEWIRTSPETVSFPFKSDDELDDWRDNVSQRRLVKDIVDGMNREVLQVDFNEGQYSSTNYYVQEEVRVGSRIKVSVYFKCASHMKGMMFVGEEASKKRTPDNHNNQALDGNDDWQLLELELNRKTDDYRIAVYLYGNRGTPGKGDYIRYRDLEIRIYQRI